MGKNPLLGKSPSGEPMHYSVGAIIKNREGKILLVDRKNPPLGLTCLAGHIDDNGEKPDDAVRREILEESGFGIHNSRLLENLTLVEILILDNNRCKHGIDTHSWTLYTCECNGTPRKEEDGAHSINWYSQAEVQQFSDEGKLEPVWEFWFKRYGIVTGVKKIEPSKKNGVIAAKFSPEKLKHLCNIDGGENCCDFLILGVKGWTCEKDTEMGRAVKALVESAGKKIKRYCE